MPTMLSKINFGLSRRRLPVTLQTESAECGLACLSMIAGYYRHPDDMAALRRRYAVSGKGMTLNAMLGVARELKLATRSLRLELNELSLLRLPCILHWDMEHFVVLKAVKGTRCIIHDPTVGERSLSLKEVSDAFTGVAVEVWPDEGFETAPTPRRVPLGALIGHVSGLRSSVIYLVMLALVIEFMGLLFPLFSQWTIDEVLVTNDRQLLVTLMIGFAITMLIQLAISAIRAWVMMYVTTSVRLQWQGSVFRHMMRLPVSFFEKRHLGDIVSRFGAVEAIQSTLSSAFFVAVLDGIMSVITLIMMFLYSPMLSLICLGALSLYIVARCFWYLPLRNATQEQIIHAAKQSTHFLETMRGVKTVKLFQRQDERAHDWLTLFVNQLNAGVRAQKLQIYYQQLNSLLFSIENIAVLGLGALLVMDQSFTVGLLMAFTAYKTQFSERFRSLVDKAFELKMLNIQTERLADIVLSGPEDSDDKPVQRLTQVERRVPSIRFDNVSFRYAALEPKVLDGISFTLQAGECVALAGSSGCGKTTIGQLALGCLLPTEGNIEVNGNTLDNYGIDNLRSITAAVLQDDVLFAGTILENIVFFEHQYDMKHAVRCAQIAGVHDDIMRMPMQYQTLVGDMGSVLSGGQKQRLFLARALYRNPLFLVLDEATSHLDIGLERHISMALKQLNITRLIIAHRPETLAQVDRILVIEQGRVLQEMTPDRLFSHQEDVPA